jgi:hypothetical protein
MDMTVIRDLLDDESLCDSIEKANSPEESQLMFLILIRNNLNTIRDTLKSIQGWVTFFGIVAVIGMVLSLFVF